MLNSLCLLFQSLIIDIGMDPVNHCRHDQFAIYFTAQPVFLACIGLQRFWQLKNEIRGSDESFRCEVAE